MTENFRRAASLPLADAAQLADQIISLRAGLMQLLTVDQIKALILAAIVDSAPATLDTLNELAAALGDDPAFATTVLNALAAKASLTGAETLTNKTLTTPDLTLKQSATPTPVAAGNVQWGTAQNALYVGDGSAQKIFRANAWEMISTVAPANVASVNWTDLSAYRKLRLTGYLRPVTDSVAILLRTSTDNGANYAAGASDYYYQSIVGADTTPVAARSTGQSGFPLGPAGLIGNATEAGLSFEMSIENFNAGRGAWFISKWTAVRAAGDIISGVVGGKRLNATARNALRLICDSGNIAEGHVTIEGLRG